MGYGSQGYGQVIYGTYHAERLSDRERPWGSPVEVNLEWGEVVEESLLWEDGEDISN